jgi:uncharacterized UBP type Zn finger protein
MTDTATKSCKSEYCDRPAESSIFASIDGYCESCRVEIRYGEDIENLVARLAEQIKDIETATYKADRTLAELMSNEIYDVEFAETSLGGDAKAELEEITRKLRNVERIVEIRQRMLKGNA